MKRDLFTESAPQVPAKATSGNAVDTSGGLTATAASYDPAALSTCGTCAEASPWITGNGHDTGFVNCGLLETWRHLNRNTTCSFSPSKWVAVDPAKLVKRNAQAGIDQAVGAADRAAPGWSDRALDWIRTYAAAHVGQRLPGFDLVQASIAAGAEQPGNGPKAWGGPIQRAARAGHLVKVGTVADPNPERHGSDVPLWECACANTR